MEINADSYITNITVYRMSNYSYGLAILMMAILFTYIWIGKGSEDKSIIIILSIIAVLSLLVGRISRIVSGDYYWYHIKNGLMISDEFIVLDGKTYAFNSIDLQKFSITEFMNKKSFLYRSVLKDHRNMIKFRTEENIIQIHFKPERKEQNDYLKQIKEKIL